MGRGNSYLGAIAKGIGLGLAGLILQHADPAFLRSARGQDDQSNQSRAAIQLEQQIGEDVDSTKEAVLLLHSIPGEQRERYIKIMTSLESRMPKGTAERDIHTAKDNFIDSIYWVQKEVLAGRLPNEAHRGLDFLLRFMPLADIRNFNQRALRNNIEFAYKAKKLPWASEYSEDLWNNFVLTPRAAYEAASMQRGDLFNNPKVKRLREQSRSIDDIARGVNREFPFKVRFDFTTQAARTPTQVVESSESGQKAHPTEIAYTQAAILKACGVASRVVLATGVKRSVRQPLWFAQYHDGNSWRSLVHEIDPNLRANVLYVGALSYAPQSDGSTQFPVIYTTNITDSYARVVPTTVRTAWEAPNTQILFGAVDEGENYGGEPVRAVFERGIVHTKDKHTVYFTHTYPSENDDSLNPVVHKLKRDIELGEGGQLVLGFRFRRNPRGQVLQTSYGNMAMAEIIGNGGYNLNGNNADGEGLTVRGDSSIGGKSIITLSDKFNRTIGK